MSLWDKPTRTVHLELTAAHVKVLIDQLERAKEHPDATAYHRRAGDEIAAYLRSIIDPAPRVDTNVVDAPRHNNTLLDREIEFRRS